ncbi:alcohol dehydrogenase transcription factor myb/sant-like [Holotrichia oblita]|uniref:Alcohol dehydrogenase transcription factor myb/sant-like n=1 Tax=Holotrichia oblita TaxID=644536 RepID=A0ACB9TS33_HOLOL|nr:alcohol dehydrogenase transcription factor myb/sant-like [Holotrichia oblita]
MDKTKKRSRSMEEISKISGRDLELSRVHLSKLGLPNQNSTRKKIHPTAIDIERIEEEDDNSVRIEIGREIRDSKESVRGSQISQKSQRSRVGSSSSKTSRATDRMRKVSSTSSKQKSIAYDNGAYDNNLDEISVVSRSSTRASSISLDIIYIVFLDLKSNTDDETQSTAESLDVDEMLISAVSVRPALYNYKLPLQERSKVKRDLLWNEIYTTLGEAKKNLKESIDSLERAFLESLNKPVTTDEVDGFLIRVAASLRRLPYRGRCQVEISIMKLLTEAEEKYNCNY